MNEIKVVGTILSVIIVCFVIFLIYLFTKFSCKGGLMGKRIKDLSSEQIVSRFFKCIIIYLIAFSFGLGGKYSVAGTYPGHIASLVSYIGGNIVKFIALVFLAETFCAALYKLLKAADIIIDNNEK